MSQGKNERYSKGSSRKEFILLLGGEGTGISATAVAKMLGISQPAVSISVEERRDNSRGGGN